MRSFSLFTLFYFTFLGLELSYLYLPASLFNGPVHILVLMLSLYPLALIFKLFPLSTFLQRISIYFELALVILVILLVTGQYLFSTLAAGQVDVFGIILRMGFCGIIWFLGYTMPHGKVNYFTMIFRLQIGILMVFIFSQAAGSALPVFFFFLLVPPALLSARWAGSFSRGSNVLQSPKLSHFFFAESVVIIPGMALILIFSPQVAQTIIRWLGNIFGRIFDWLDGQHSATAGPSEGVKWDFSCNFRPEQAGAPTGSIPSPSAGYSTEISPVVIWIIAFIIFLAIVVVIGLILRQRKSRRRKRQEEPVRFQLSGISLGIFRSLLKAIPRLLLKLWYWLKLLFQKQPGPPEEPLSSIRALYRNLLYWAAEQGASHIPTQTPLEYLEILGQKFPRQHEDLKQITEAYLLDRYSLRPISPNDFARIEKAWQRVLASQAG